MIESAPNMVNSFILIFKNKIVIVSIISWITAQSLKVAFGVFREKRFNFKWFIGTGGMPSSHAAGVMALATSVGMESGFNSVNFAIVLVFSLIVLFDAQSTRRTIGTQAEILNKIMDDIYWKKKIEAERLRELIGHTPVEVFAGSALGIFISLLAYVYH